MNFSFHYRGLYITINDIGHVYDVLCNWPEPVVKVPALFFLSVHIV